MSSLSHDIPLICSFKCHFSITISGQENGSQAFMAEHLFAISFSREKNSFYNCSLLLFHVHSFPPYKCMLQVRQTTELKVELNFMNSECFSVFIAFIPLNAIQFILNFFFFLFRHWNRKRRKSHRCYLSCREPKLFCWLVLLSLVLAVSYYQPSQHSLPPSPAATPQPRPLKTSPRRPSWIIQISHSPLRLPLWVTEKRKRIRSSTLFMIPRMTQARRLLVVMEDAPLPVTRTIRLMSITRSTGIACLVFTSRCGCCSFFFSVCFVFCFDFYFFYIPA